MKIKVAIHGMDKRSKERMLTIFSVNYKGQCEYTDIDHADTAIVDMDDKEINTEWAVFRSAHPDIPVIIMAKDHIDLKGTTYIAKPANIAELLTALKESSQKEISSKLSVSKSTHNVANALQDRIQISNRNTETPPNLGIYYKPEKFLQGKVVQAIKEGNKLNKSIFLKCWKDHWIITFPSANFILQNVDDQKIGTFGIIQIGDKIDQMSYSEHTFTDDEISHMANTPTSKVKLAPIDQFIWNLTVKTARGRVPEGTSLDDLYVVRHWPNLPQLLYIPNATRITAFWVDRPQSINNISSKLNIPLKDVLTYFSAANAIGILKSAKRKADEIVTPDVIRTDEKKRNVFAALFNIVQKNIAPKKEAAVQEG